MSLGTYPEVSSWGRPARSATTLPATGRRHRSQCGPPGGEGGGDRAYRHLRGDRPRVVCPLRTDLGSGSRQQDHHPPGARRGLLIGTRSITATITAGWTPLDGGLAHRESGAVETAHRAIQNCGQVFRYAIATGRTERNPAADLRGALYPGQGTALCDDRRP